MRLYSKGQLDDIRTKLLAGEKKFNSGIYKFIFTEGDDWFLQRISNFALGLGYVKSSDSFAFNYPHINNVRKTELTEITSGVYQPKANGCLSGNTPILLSDFTHVKIKDIVEKKLSVEVLTVNPVTKQIEKSKVVGWSKTPPKKFVRVAMKNTGRHCLKLTEDHRICNNVSNKMTLSYKPAGELNSTDSAFHIERRISTSQRQFIFGTLLGDSSIPKNKTRHLGAFVLSRAINMSSYLDKVSMLFAPFHQYMRNRKAGYGTTVRDLRVSLRKQGELGGIVEEMHEKCLVNGKKRITFEWLKEVDSLALAVWYMDDGTYFVNNGKQDGLSIATNSFDGHEIELLQAMLQWKFNIHSTYNDGSLHIYGTNAAVFFNIIKDYVTDEFKYKLPEQLRMGSGTEWWNDNKIEYGLKSVRVESVEAAEVWSSCYDIQTENNHTFFAAYFLVHNSNIGIVKVGDELWHRTRGTLKPEKFLNEINTTIIQNKSGIIGVSPDVFKVFRVRYEPILKVGIEKGVVDAYGNFVLTPEIINGIKSAVAPAFEASSVVAVFGELCSRWNPICVSPDIDAGIYIGDSLDYRYVIFDVLSRTEEGDISFWDAKILDQLPINKSANVSIIPSYPLSMDALNQFMGSTKEEGIIVKNSNSFVKFKRSDVLDWERLVSNLSNIVIYSVNHLFEQEFSFSSDDILSGKLKQSGIIDEIRKAAYEEMGNQGVSQAELVNFYISRAARNKRADEPPMTPEAAESSIERSLNDQIVEKLLLQISPALRNNGVEKSKLYLEIPKVFTFPRGAPVFYDEKRGKFRPYEWYGKLVSNIIGRSYG